MIYILYLSSENEDSLPYLTYDQNGHGNHHKEADNDDKANDDDHQNLHRHCHHHHCCHHHRDHNHDGTMTTVMTKMTKTMTTTTTTMTTTTTSNNITATNILCLQVCAELYASRRRYKIIRET